MSSILAFALLLTLFVCVFAPPPGLYDSQRWVPNDGCPRGGVYFLRNRSVRCHCWGFQGYICEPDGRNGRAGLGGSGGNGDGCPPGATVCVINNNSNSNSNTNSNSNSNANSNQNGNRNGNGNNKPDYGSDYANYDG